MVRETALQVTLTHHFLVKCVESDMSSGVDYYIVSRSSVCLTPGLSRGGLVIEKDTTVISLQNLDLWIKVSFFCHDLVLPCPQRKGGLDHYMRFLAMCPNHVHKRMQQQCRGLPHHQTTQFLGEQKSSSPTSTVKNECPATFAETARRKKEGDK